LSGRIRFVAISTGDFRLESPSIQIHDYHTLMRSIKSNSTRQELARLITSLLLVRVARELGCRKLILADNMEPLANASIVALCYGRGESRPR
jgi:hypothetical protein